LTTQYLDEADRLADRIAVVDQGVVIAEGTSDQLKHQVGGDRLEGSLCEGADAEAALRALAPVGGGEPAGYDHTVSVPIASGRGTIAEAVRRLDDGGVAIDDIAIRRPTLDDVFLKLTGHTAEAEEEQEGGPSPTSPRPCGCSRSAASKGSPGSRTSWSASRSSQ